MEAENIERGNEENIQVVVDEPALKEQISPTNKKRRR